MVSALLNAALLRWKCTPMKVIMDIQWMVCWRVLVEFGPKSHNGNTWLLCIKDAF